MVRYPPLILRSTQAHLCDTHFATYRAIIVRYAIKTSTKEFCDTISTSIARYEKYRCWPLSLFDCEDINAALGLPRHAQLKPPAEEPVLSPSVFASFSFSLSLSIGGSFFTYINNVQTRCIVKGEPQKSPLFWRFLGVLIFSGSSVL